MRVLDKKWDVMATVEVFEGPLAVLPIKNSMRLVK